MALKLKFLLISAMYILCTEFIRTGASCHLDHMKNFALNSCEMLITALESDLAYPQNERLKREIVEAHSHYDVNRHILPIHLRMKNSTFPADGYIVLDRLHAKILRMAYPHVFKIIPKKLYHSHANQRTHPAFDDNQLSNEVPYRRRKRHHTDEKDDEKVNVTYCCASECHYHLCDL